jgi:glycosyltransferase involved in cell wall biosynthesis
VGRRVLYFGTYDRGIGRNAILIDALRAAGIDVTECAAPVWRDTADKLAAVGGRSSPAAIALRQAAAWGRSLRAYAAAPDYDALFVGATAHLDLPLARLLAGAAGRPLFFDPLVSIVETVRDRGIAPPAGGLRAMAAVERRLVRLPDRIVVDTRTHAEALAAEIGLPIDRAVVAPAGAPPAFRRAARPYAARRPSPEEPLRVLYVGQYIPLHGIDVVLEAAGLLRDRPDIRFDLVGRGQTLPDAVRLVRRMELANVHLHDTWLPAERLAAEHIDGADLCLGVFGSEPKAERVVPFKVYTALASARPALTADTRAVREMLRPGSEVWCVPASDPRALAAAIEYLAERPALRADLAALGQRAFDARFSPSAIGSVLREAVEAAIDAASPPALLGPRHAWRQDLLRGQLVDAAPSGLVLDAGCGSADLAAALRASGREVIAVDRDLTGVRRARLASSAADASFSGDAAAGRRLVCADLRALPFPDGTFGGVAAGEVLEHVADDRAAVAELARVLTAGGALAATVPAGPGRYGDVDLRAGHARRYSGRDLRRLVAGAGMRIERLRGWGFPFGRVYDLLAARSAWSSRHGKARGLLAKVGRSPVAHRVWRTLFDVDERVRSGELGSGWLLVARRSRAAAERLPRAGRDGG